MSALELEGTPRPPGKAVLRNYKGPQYSSENLLSPTTAMHLSTSVQKLLQKETTNHRTMKLSSKEAYSRECLAALGLEQNSHEQG